MLTILSQSAGRDNISAVLCCGHENTLKEFGIIDVDLIWSDPYNWA